MRRLDHRNALEALAQVVHVEEGERELGIDAGGRKNLVLAHLRDAGDRHLLEAEADGAGQRMMRLAVIADEAVDMAALPEAEPDDGGKEAEGEAGSEETRKALLERSAGGAPAHAARGAEQLLDSRGILELGRALPRLPEAARATAIPAG